MEDSVWRVSRAASQGDRPTLIGQLWWAGGHQRRPGFIGATVSTRSSTLKQVTGKLLWDGTARSPACHTSTTMVNGKQYVVIAAAEGNRAESPQAACMSPSRFREGEDGGRSSGSSYPSHSSHPCHPDRSVPDFLLRALNDGHACGSP